MRQREPQATLLRALWREGFAGHKLGTRGHEAPQARLYVQYVFAEFRIVCCARLPQCVEVPAAPAQRLVECQAFLRSAEDRVLVGQQTFAMGC